MKTQHSVSSACLSVLGVLAISFQTCWGVISFDIQAGEFRDSTGVVVSDSSLWAVVYDANNDGSLPGDLGLNEHITTSDASSVLGDFAAVTIATGLMVGGDRILWAGAVDGEATSGVSGVGATTALSDFTFSSLEVAAGRNWAIYWFPGLTVSSNTLPSSSFEVGGIQLTNAGSGGTLGMVFPGADDTGFTYTIAAIGESLDGDVPDVQFTAVTAVPETSTLALSALGAAALLRRGRRG
jgi:hypothetical protein